jgi:hypothetical protein
MLEGATTAKTAVEYLMLHSLTTCPFAETAETGVDLDHNTRSLETELCLQDCHNVCAIDGVTVPQVWSDSAMQNKQGGGGGGGAEVKWFGIIFNQANRDLP